MSRGLGQSMSTDRVWGSWYHEPQAVGFTLRIRLVWLQRRREGCWSGLQLQVEPEVHAMFDASFRFVVGDGRMILF